MKIKSLALASVMAFMLSNAPNTWAQENSVDYPVTFRFIVQSQGDTTSTETRASSRIVRTRLTNREILETLGLPTTSRIVIRVTEDNGQLNKSVIAGDTDITDALSQLLPLDFITVDDSVFDDPSGFVNNANGHGVLTQMSVKQSSARSTASITQTSIENVNANLTEGVTISGVNNVRSVVSVSRNNNDETERLTFKESGTFTGSGNDDGQPIIVTGTWRTSGRSNVDFGSDEENTDES